MNSVRVLVGRNKGQVGRAVSETETAVYVDFNRKILVNEGFGSMAYYDDAYWVDKKNVEPA